MTIYPEGAVAPLPGPPPRNGWRGRSPRSKRNANPLVATEVSPTGGPGPPPPACAERNARFSLAGGSRSRGLRREEGDRAWEALLLSRGHDEHPVDFVARGLVVD